LTPTSYDDHDDDDGGDKIINKWNRSPDHRSPGQRFWPGRVGSRVSVPDPVLSFNMQICCGFVSAE